MFLSVNIDCKELGSMVAYVWLYKHKRAVTSTGQKQNCSKAYHRLYTANAYMEIFAVAQVLGGWCFKSSRLSIFSLLFTCHSEWL